MNGAMYPGIQPDSLQYLTTEAECPASREIDTMSPLQIVQLMNAEDAATAVAVSKTAESVAAAIAVISDRIQRGGRLIYLGAGTSGRLGVLDASECPPTFNTRPEMVLGLIAGGDTALRTAVEGAEDDPERAVEDLKRIQIGPKDVLVGIASSGRTPYVTGGLRYAQSVGTFTVGLTCNVGSPMTEYANLMIEPVVGPEIISGSTRLKAGTATKMILNMLSTGTMVLLGKTCGNLMVDLRASNTKLMIRSRRIVASLTDLSEEQAEQELNACQGELKTAVVKIRRGVDQETARRILARCQGRLREALKNSPDAEGGQP